MRTGNEEAKGNYILGYKRELKGRMQLLYIYLLYLRTLREYFEYTRKPFHAILQTAIY
jgi:hypothetical protein